MNKKTTLIMGLCLFLKAVVITAQPLCRVIKYNEKDGVPSSHVTQLLQDEKGFMWFATWNGLCRYDGYEFQIFKPQAGDGCHMTTDRIRNITLLPINQILCQVDLDYYMFDLSTYFFRDLTATEQEQVEAQTIQYRQSRSLKKPKGLTWTDDYQTRWTIYGNGQLVWHQPEHEAEVDYPLNLSFRTLTFAMPDSRGNLWALDYGSIYQFTTDVQRTNRLSISPQAEVKCLFTDHQGRHWLATKDDKVVRIYDKDLSLIGYLGSDGRLHKQYTSFGAAVYCMYETKKGTLWLGTKPNGLYRLYPAADGVFKIDHFEDMSCPDIYHIKEDRYGRLWVATLGGGLCYTTLPDTEHPHFETPRYYPGEQCQRARFLYITRDDVMLVATSMGLLVSRLQPQADAMRFVLHHREPDRTTSLSSSAIMDIIEDSSGHLLVSTESGGVNAIVGHDLLKEQLDFRHINVASHQLSSDVIQSMSSTPSGKTLIVSSRQLSLLDTAGHVRVLDAHYYHNDYRFSEAHPLLLDNGQWLFGLSDGAFIMSADKIDSQAYRPRVVLTRVSIQDGNSNWSVESLDTLTLQSSERSLTVHFAALDFYAPERISYAFRLLPNEQWNYIGHDRSATLLDLEPGTYRLEIRSTNADGEWLHNERMLTLIVKPTFWESTWGRLLLLLLSACFLTAIVYTILYIRRIKRKQRETLDKYLALIELSEKQSEENDVHSQQDVVSAPHNLPQTTELDPTLQRIIEFVDNNISNSDSSVGDMAEAAAVSRSGLQRKLKQAMSITPQDLMKEARIKRACQLLDHTDKTVSEVAYACGFTDPKYFSRCFRQSTGQSPTEYKSEK